MVIVIVLDASPHVAVAVAVNCVPSKREYVVAPRVQSGVPAVAASHWSMAELKAASSCARPWNGIVPALWQGNVIVPEMQMISS